MQNPTLDGINSQAFGVNFHGTPNIVNSVGYAATSLSAGLAMSLGLGSISHRLPTLCASRWRTSLPAGASSSAPRNRAASVAGAAGD